VRLPVRAPETVGANVMLMLHVLSAAIVGQLLVALKSPLA
jgi:hypothetical protein